MRLPLASAIPILLFGVVGCEGTFVLAPDDPRIDLSAATPSLLTQPLFLIGDRVASFAEVRELDSGQIERIEVIKGTAAIAIYGERGRNGVVTISLKSGVGLP